MKALALLALLAGCASPLGPSPAPTPAILDLRGVIAVEGKWSAQVYMGGVPVLTLIEGSGKASLTVLPHPPWVTVDADHTTTIVPSAEAVAARADGRLLIRRGGISAGFAPEAEAPVGPPPPPQDHEAPPTESPK